jgi:hypothetical protein
LTFAFPPSRPIWARYWLTADFFAISYTVTR